MVNERRPEKWQWVASALLIASGLLLVLAGKAPAQIEGLPPCVDGNPAPPGFICCPGADGPGLGDACCGSIAYDSETEGCCADGPYSLDGEVCCNGSTKSGDACCDGEGYYTEIQGCCESNVGTQPYRLADECCCSCCGVEWCPPFPEDIGP